ncbi:MAG TPA: bifunctional 3-deoxy-7-phosphoheptulonate synthase/chorismate mutase [Bacteroidia bacterium]|nr:bifunctional 3-deoxy-7-phosphoheptulonate synthase/chorismate mutase [Bacteroidia bacterium]
MIIRLHKTISPADETVVRAKIGSAGYKETEVVTRQNRYLVCTGTKPLDIRAFGNLPGVSDVHFVSDVNQLVSREWKVQDTIVDLGNDCRIGNGTFTVMAGPCSVESEEQVRKTVGFLIENNIRIMRGGVFKPRSSPYAFRGLGIDGLKMFHDICSEKGIRIVTEVMQADQIEDMFPYVDIFQVGARNAQNFTLLDALGRCGKPVLLKRGLSGTIEELLASAEYIFSNGNEQIILCERGIRTYEKAYRNTLDLNAVPILKSRSHLPVIVDPSHGIGIRSHVEPVALAAVMAGADGIIAEIHETPEKALSDGQQTLNFEEAAALTARLRKTYGLRKSFGK